MSIKCILFTLFVLLCVSEVFPAEEPGEGTIFTPVVSVLNITEIAFNDPGYILAESASGLSNRLRVLAAYMYVAEYKYNGAQLVFIWDITSACPGHFLQLFLPISNVVFATNSSRYVLDKGAKIVYEASNAVFTWTLQMNGIPRNRFGHLTWSQAERKMYQKYYPTREIMTEVMSYVSQYNVCNISAMHIRTTDLNRLLVHSKKKPVSIEPYYYFVENTPKDEPVFLLTDSPATQKDFLDRYGEKKILVYSLITGGGGSSSPGGHKRSHQTNRLLSESGAMPDDHRFTSLEHTLIDVLIAAHSKNFKGAAFSSLTDLVHIFSSIGKEERGWCNHAKI